VDAALYALHLGARIVPAVADVDAAAAAAAAACGGGLPPPRLALENSLRSRWAAATSAAPALLVAPNPEQLALGDVAPLAAAAIVLCKTFACERDLTRLMARLGSSARVFYTGHTSLDVAAPEEEGDGGGEAAAAARDWDHFLHIRGRSGLKHTRELLRCWASRAAAWPEARLTVVGTPLSEADLAAAFEGRPPPGNLRFLPAEGGNASAGVPAHELRALQRAAGVHVCASEREGFGHYLNEARAAGALVVTTRHEPMRELVEDGVSGLLAPVVASAAFYDAQALAPVASPNARLTPEGLCSALERARAMPAARRAALGAAARAAYVAERAAFGRRMARLRHCLTLRAAPAGALANCLHAAGSRHGGNAVWATLAPALPAAGIAAAVVVLAARRRWRAT